jgi:hypothetical protein
MVTKLNQIVAIVKTTKETTNKLTAPLFQSMNVLGLFAGQTATYRTAIEEGQMYPPNEQRVQLTVPTLIDSFRRPTERLLDVISTAETTNTHAFGDIVVDGVAVAEQVPVTFLMQLEKYLEREVRGFINNMPVLDPALDWSRSPAERVGVWETESFETAKTKKVQTPLVLYPATDKHPAQTQLITEDIVEGYWSKKAFSGALPASEKAALQERVEKLIEAVKKAREQANDIEVTDAPVGGALMAYVFGGSPTAASNGH